jgi:phospholipid/cholesterol/gamma-HCH transport system ATP-binding protein
MSEAPTADDRPGAAPSGQPFVELVGLHKAFGANSVLRDLDLQVHPGEVLTILGGSGSGKSVTLKHVIGLLRADGGAVRVEGVDVTNLSESQWIEVRKRFGYVFQGAALFDSLSVYENIAYPLREHRVEWPEVRVAERVATCLEAVGLDDVEALMPAELSGGMRKRVGVARAIALEPAAILYDEPTTGLDPANSARIGRLIRSLQQRLQVTSVVVTHDPVLCRAVSDRIALLRDGRVVVEGRAEDLHLEALSEIRAFLEGEDDDGEPAASQPEGGARGA